MRVDGLKDSRKRSGDVRSYVFIPLGVFLLVWNCGRAVQSVGRRNTVAVERETAVLQSPHAIPQARKIASHAKDAVIEATSQQTSADDSLVIDIVSVGSIHKTEWQAGQARTFVRHATVRNFFAVNELNDTDITCHTDFTMGQLHDVVNFCNTTANDAKNLLNGVDVEYSMRSKLFSPKESTGWLCAQQRPTSGIQIALERYKTEPLPSHLLVIDDDTFLNMDKLVDTIETNYPPEEANAIAGCGFTWPKKLQFAFAYGGFGTILTRRSLERLLRPIYCNSNDEPDEFTRLTCWRLQYNHVGERNLFEEGMSVGDLMFKYSTAHPFTKVHEWKESGYCFHSDHYLGYFVNFYHLAVPEATVAENRVPHDNIRIHNSYNYIAGESECENEKRKCTADSRICHYIKPKRMDELFAQQQSALKA